MQLDALTKNTQHWVLCMGTNVRRRNCTVNAVYAAFDATISFYVVSFSFFHRFSVDSRVSDRAHMGMALAVRYVYAYVCCVDDDISVYYTCMQASYTKLRLLLLTIAGLRCLLLFSTISLNLSLV